MFPQNERRKVKSWQLFPKRAQLEDKRLCRQRRFVNSFCSSERLLTTWLTFDKESGIYIKDAGQAGEIKLRVVLYAFGKMRIPVTTLQLSPWKFTQWTTWTQNGSLISMIPLSLTNNIKIAGDWARYKGVGGRWSAGVMRKQGMAVDRLMVSLSQGLCIVGL